MAARPWFPRDEIEMRWQLRSDPCCDCGRYPHRKRRNLDHIVPVAHGEPSDVSTLSAACERCNAAKWSYDLLTYLLAREELEDLERRRRRLQRKRAKRRQRALVAAQDAS